MPINNESPAPASLAPLCPMPMERRFYYVKKKLMVVSCSCGVVSKPPNFKKTPPDRHCSGWLTAGYLADTLPAQRHVAEILLLPTYRYYILGIGLGLTLTNKFGCWGREKRAERAVGAQRATALGLRVNTLTHRHE